MNQGKEPALVPYVSYDLLGEVGMLKIHVGMILFPFPGGQPSV